jgi:hypothetical protein
MLCARLVVLALLSQGQAGDSSQEAATFVEQLGSPLFAAREAAARELEQIGRPALNALRGARDSRDPEVRTRAATVAERIENALLTQPTRVQLDFRNALLPEIARSLSAQAGFRVELNPVSSPRWRDQRVDLREPSPVAFWKAIDLLCDHAGLQYNSNMRGHVDNGEPIFTLSDGATRALTPNSDQGPFRVTLIGVDYQKHVTYAPASVKAHVPPPPEPVGQEPERREAIVPPRLNPVANVQFSAQIMVAAEPRLALSQASPVELLEALDDRGNSLLPVGEDDSVRNRDAGYFGMSTSPVIQLQAPLHRPSTAGEWIKKLRGVVSLTVSSRRPHPLVIPLVSATGKTFESQEHRLTIHDIRPSPTNHNLLVELSIKANDKSESTERVNQDVFSDGFQRADPQHLQIEFIDARGHMIPWFQSFAEAETSRFTLTLANQTHPLNLKELRYYTLSRGIVPIPFEFTDIPMP